MNISTALRPHDLMISPPSDIRVFIGSHEKFARCEPVVQYSILKNTRALVKTIVVRPEYYGMGDSGCTGFTNVRYAMPEICNFEGFAIYLDVDMLVLADIAELYEYRQAGKWVQMVDGDNEVSVIDCAAMRGVLPPLDSLHKFRKWHVQPKLNSRTANVIPADWNVKDRLSPDAKLVHFTDLDRQPWFCDNHPCPAACDLWFEYEREAMGGGKTTIVNFTSMDQMDDYINSGAADDIIYNRIEKAGPGK